VRIIYSFSYLYFLLGLRRRDCTLERNRLVDDAVHLFHDVDLGFCFDWFQRCTFVWATLHISARESFLGLQLCVASLHISVYIVVFLVIYRLVWLLFSVNSIELTEWS
jgi:hypothetical protein